VHPEPGSRLRVLIVDDSVVMRRVLARTLERAPDIARTDFAANGQIALAKIAERRPDVVVLDLEMPVLDGFQTLREVRRLHPQLPVVLFSGVDETTAAAALDGLSLGVTELVLKPTASGIDEAEAYVAQHLLPLVRALAAPRPTAPPATAAAPPETGAPVEVEAVVVGVSTGGPDALDVVLRALPAELPVPILVVQHMPPMFTRLLAERLHRLGGTAGARGAGRRRGPQLHRLHRAGRSSPAPGAPGHRTCAWCWTTDRRRTPAVPPRTCCSAPPSTVYGSGTLGMVLTGMGHDGLRGCEAVRVGGGQVLVQDPATAVVGSMPASVRDAGLAHAALPLEPLVVELLRRLARTAA
jgi:two-component system chemotaxis response regulator CheB